MTATDRFFDIVEAGVKVFLGLFLGLFVYLLGVVLWLVPYAAVGAIAYLVVKAATG